MSSSLWDSRYFPVSPYPNGFRTTALVGDWEAVRRQAVRSLYTSSFIPKLFFFETEGYCTITTLGPQGVTCERYQTKFIGEIYGT